MRFTLIGGDDRQVYLKNLLEKDGHETCDFALTDEKEIEEALKLADAVILPLPAFRDGYLNAAKVSGKYEKEYIMSKIEKCPVVFGGMTDEEFIHDYYKRPELIIKNALITAQCAIALLQSEIKREICGMDILVAGYGRIGKFLANQLRAMGADVTVSARKTADKATAQCYGLSAIDTDKISRCTAKYDAVINTVPSPIIGKDAIETSREDCVFMELASPPYGIDMDCCKAFGRKVIFAPGLPGKMMPAGAAKAIKDTIYNMMEEINEQD